MVSLWRWIVGLLSVLIGRVQVVDTSSGTDTEFTAEVVRIVEVSPHQNADRLEIARFEMRRSGPSAYEVVIPKGTYKVGDLAAYFSVDCVLPTAHPEFAFLLTRPDCQGKIHYRLRAARLRGVFSQGLLVPAPFDRDGIGFEYGRSVAAEFGVTYHRDPEPEEKGGPTAPTAKPRPQPMPVYAVDSLKKVPRLFDPDELVVVTEKIHGTNCRFGWVPRNEFAFRICRLFGVQKYRFVVGSHRVIKDGGGGGPWYGEDLWSSAAKEMGLQQKTAGYPGHVFYGELYGFTKSGKAIQDLTYGRKPEAGPGLAVFDVRGPDGWLSFPRRMAVLNDCSIPSVPILSIGECFGEGGTGVKSFAASGLKSTLDSKTIREGVVAETWFGGKERKKAKFVGEDYLMRKGAS